MMLEMTIIHGEDKGKIILYALSTCGWCAKTKRYLDKLGVSYSFVYVDMLTGEDSKEAKSQVQRWNPLVSFPTIVINDEICIIGYKPEKISEALR